MLAKTTKALKCITGKCSHNSFNKDCLFNQICDAKNPETKEIQLLTKLINDEIKYAIMNERTKKQKSTAKPTTKKTKTIKTVKAAKASKTTKKKEIKK